MLLITWLGGAGAAGEPMKAPARATVAPAVAKWMTPAGAYSGALLTPALDQTGSPRMDARTGGFQPFVHPTAVAGRGPDIYVADLATSTVYRFDWQRNVMAVVPGIRAQAGTQLYVGPDLSLYVVDPQGRRVVQYSRSGQMLAQFRDELNLGRPVDVAFDEARNRVLVADGMYNQLVAFHPLGRASYAIPLRGGAGERVAAIAALAVGASGIYLSDPVCGCIVHVSLDGRVVGTFGQNEINQPGSIAVDRDDRVFVIDTLDGSLKIFARGEMVQEFSPGDLNLPTINDVWIRDGSIILSGGQGAAIRVFQLVPPAAR